MEEKVVNKVPWWGISVMVHVLMFLILTTIAAFTVREKTTEVIISHIDRTDIEPIPEDEKEKPKPVIDITERPEETKDPVDMKFAKDNAQTPDEDFTKDLKGTSMDNSSLTDFKFANRRIDTIGRGPGGERSKGRPNGGLDAVGNGKIGIPGGTYSAILEALKWLARHQKADGSWATSRFCANCGSYGYKSECSPNEYPGNEEYDVGNTGLALLAFLGAGYTPGNKSKVFEGSALTYGDVVKRGLRFLVNAQDISGRIGPEVKEYMYNHAIASLAVIEGFDATGNSAMRGPAQKAVDFLVKAKNPGFGWRYVYQAGATDSSVTGWCVMALKSAENAGISFDRAVYSDLRRWYDDSTTEVDYTAIDCKPNSVAGTSVGKLTLTGYKSTADAGKLVAVRGVNDQYYYNPALTAIMIMSTVFIERKNIGKSARAVDSLMSFLPQKWSPQDRSSWRVADMYYWYYASYALYQVFSKDNDNWKRWNKAMETALLETQNLKGFEGQCKRGSWEPVDRWSCEGGRVYTTAMGALTLEVYFRYTKVLQEKK